ncbi:UDP-galactopyranose mutase [Bordetella genomosp. 13]|uniref:UDP-galactopyranose mutase n=1 Tax=Bordetella genomosp. 13 TaxID=463040 RepID=UPI001C9310CB|nr:UDP-galactopyranose mutase [Bordetella genomosp. 13]
MKRSAPDSKGLDHAAGGRNGLAPRDWLTRRRPAIICFSHLRWDFVYQRPQHLMSRFARDLPVYYLEEPIREAEHQPRLEERIRLDGVHVVVPHLGAQRTEREAEQDQKALLDELLDREQIETPVLWYYTPMSMAFSAHVPAGLVVYDCMDELSAFMGAPPEMIERERRLLARADVVFTGGYSLYESKRALHPNVHPYPSSVDVAHFKRARAHVAQPPDQRGIGRPRIGFYGVLDERLDRDLVAKVAALRPDWHLVLVGPVVKIDPAKLPQAPNIHYLGAKRYDELPAYLAGWEVALMPFALNESTRYISPTKTPEYLAGGRPVVSTPIVDVVRTYGHSGLVRVAETADAFVQAVEEALAEMADPAEVAASADEILGSMSWERTWQGMRNAMNQARDARSARPAAQNGGRPLAPPATPVAERYDYLIVGAGFAGSVLAERLAASSGKRVLVIDKRAHVAGNAYDHDNEHGILVHRYGPHIFHTNSDKVVQYLSRFTQWRPYEHRVLAHVDGKLVPMPVNLATLGALYGRTFDPEQARRFLAARAEAVADVQTSEDVVVSQIGRELYEKFFRGYTRKQWGLDPSQLDRSVAARVPARMSLDDRYFTDSFQQMPAEGYTRMFEKMLEHPNIEVMLNTEFSQVRDRVRFDKLIYTGPIDEYFGHRFGRLPYRSLQFRHETLDQPWLQPVGVVNYPSEDVPHTRITEYKHLTGQQHPKTAVTYEIPSAQGDPYYPIPRPGNMELFKRYQALADAQPDVYFVGRLATYRYYNMDQVVAQALATYAVIMQDERAGPRASADLAAA